MQNVRVEDLSDEELKDISIQILAELKERESKKKIVCSFTQKHSALVCTEDGTPVDRPSWFYLPFLKEASGMFQPKKTASGYLYNIHEEGKVLTIRGTGERVRTGGAGFNKTSCFSGRFTAAL